jgi:hypothetical protein
MIDFIIRFCLTLIILPIIFAATIGVLYIPVWLGFDWRVSAAWAMILLAAIYTYEGGKE